MSREFDKEKYLQTVKLKLVRRLKIFLPRKAVGDIIPVLLATTMAMPDSKYGAVKSTAASLSELI